MKKIEITEEELIKAVTDILGEIIESNTESLLQGDYHIRPDYGEGKFYLDAIDGGYDMSLYLLVHYILYQEGLYAKFLDEGQYKDMEEVVNNYPEAIYGPGDETDADNEARELIDLAHYSSIKFVGNKLVSMACDVEAIFADYLDSKED